MGDLRCNMFRPDPIFFFRSKNFKKAMRGEAAERGAAIDRERFEGLEPEVAREERAIVWEERLQLFARKSGKNRPGSAARTEVGAGESAASGCNEDEYLCFKRLAGRASGNGATGFSQPICPSLSADEGGGRRR